MGKFARIVKGDPRKKSRFHDYEERIPPLPAWVYLPHSLVTTIRFKLTACRPEIPWLGYRAIKKISSLIDQSSSVLEFGSGMSTIWFARKGIELLSIETDPEWYELINNRLKQSSNRKATLLLEKPPFTDRITGARKFDFALVDGEGRDTAVAVALKTVMPGGHIYLDNADAPVDGIRSARDLLLRAGEAEWFVDFTPTQFFVSTGLMVKLR